MHWYLATPIVLATLAFGGCSDQQQPTARPADIESRIEALFADYDKSDSPGCVVGIIKDGEFVYQRGFGMANLEHGVPITPKSAFYIASTSKQFTAMVVLMLAAEGKISLDEDIRTYVPELPQYDRPITIRQLLTHTSGIRDYLMLKQYAGIRVDSPFNDEQTLALLARQKSLNFTPGKRSSYSNSGYKLLALIVQRQGVTLGAYAKQHIFQPLEMDSTFYLENVRQIVKNRVQGYDRSDDDSIVVKDFSASNIGPGGVITTLEDLLLWDQNFYNPRVGGQEILSQLLMPGRLNDGTMSREAPGLIIDQYRSLPIVEHSGRGRGFTAQMLRFPEQKFTVIVLCNLHRGPADQRCFDIADIYLESKLARPKSAGATNPVEPVVDLPAIDSHPLTGVYVVDSDVLEIALEGSTLTATLNGTTTRVLQPLGENRFHVVGRAWELTFRREGTPRADSVTLEINGNADLVTFTEPKVVSESEAKEFSGQYYSEELDVLYHVSVEDGRLQIRLNDVSKYEVFPKPLITMGNDEFSDGHMTSILFHRRDDSSVTGFRLDDPRVTNIRFVKQG